MEQDWTTLSKPLRDFFLAASAHLSTEEIVDEHRVGIVPTGFDLLIPGFVLGRVCRYDDADAMTLGICANLVNQHLMLLGFLLMLGKMNQDIGPSSSAPMRERFVNSGNIEVVGWLHF